MLNKEKLRMYLLLDIFVEYSKYSKEVLKRFTKILLERGSLGALHGNISSGKKLMGIFY